MFQSFGENYEPPPGVPWAIATTPDRPWFPLDVRSAAASSANLAPGMREGPPWQGFGACFNEIGGKLLRDLPGDEASRLLDDLFGNRGMALNYCRMPIGANDFSLDWYTPCDRRDDLALDSFSLDRDEEYLLPFVREGLARRDDMILFASPWSPPVWYKDPPVFNYGRMRRETEYRDSYARYLQRFVEECGKREVRIDAVHHQNEPNSDQKFPSCVWEAADFRGFLSEHALPAFAELDGCELWAGTIEKDRYEEWIHPLLSDEDLRSRIGGVGLQWEAKHMVGKIHRAFPEMPLIQTENECCAGENSWADLMYVFDLFYRYITGGVCAYVYWNILLPSGGRSTWGWTQNSLATVEDEKLLLQPEYFLLKHFSYGVRRGARCLDLSGRWAGSSVSFRNPDGSLVIVACNTASSEEDLILNVGKSGCAVSLPPRAIATLVLPANA